MRRAAAAASAALLVAAAAAALAPERGASGHGVGYELLDPVRIDGVGLVSLEVQSSEGGGPDGAGREVRLSLLDAASGVTVRDVTFEVAVAKTGTDLFGGTFETGDGILVLALDGTGDPASVEIVDEGKRGGLLESLVGLDEAVVHARGGPLAAGGLYLIDVAVRTAGSFDRQLDPPVRFAAGLSIPDTTTYEIDDADFGRQEISVITYYDTVGRFEYDPALRSLSFEMPFDWGLANINETSIVHEELSFDRRFGDMMASRYEVSVNGVRLPDRVVTIDDLTLDGGRIVHMVLNQNDLYYLLGRQGQEGAAEGHGGLMRFELEAGERAPLGATAENGQFRVSVGWDPWYVRSGGDVEFGFNITDVFLRDRPVSAEYDVSLVHEESGAVIASASGATDASQRTGATLAASVPAGMGGPAVLRFENLGGAALARAEIPIVIDRVGAGNEAGAVVIPGWIKDSARWWADGRISDQEFARGIQYMMEEGIVAVPGAGGAGGAGGGEESIPAWVKDSARWWADGRISDQEFASGIQYMVKEGIIRA